MPNTERMPTCEEFLVFTVRYLRRNRNEIHGVRLALAYKAAHDKYSDVEIRDALNALLRRNVLLIVARYSEFLEGRPTVVYKPLPRILNRYPLDDDVWRYAPNGKLLQRGESGTRIMFSKILVYVIRDGLPVTVQQILEKAVKRPPPKLGDRILEAMLSERDKKK